MPVAKRVFEKQSMVVDGLETYLNSCLLYVGHIIFTPNLTSHACVVAIDL